MRVFLSHPISTYCSPQEDVALTTLAAAGHEVINPSDPPVQDSCGPDMSKWAALAASADAVAFLPLPDGRIGAGMVMEIESSLSVGHPVFALSADGATLSPVSDWPGSFELVSLEETRSIMRAFKAGREAQGLTPVPRRSHVSKLTASGPRLR